MTSAIMEPVSTGITTEDYDCEITEGGEHCRDEAVCRAWFSRSCRCGELRERMLMCARHRAVAEARMIFEACDGLVTLVKTEPLR